MSDQPTFVNALVEESTKRAIAYIATAEAPLRLDGVVGRLAFSPQPRIPAAKQKKLIVISRVSGVPDPFWAMCEGKVIARFRTGRAARIAYPGAVRE